MQNNVIDFERSPGAAEQARHWVTRIDAGELSAAERQELRSWLAQDPAHARLLDEHALLWAAASHARFPPPHAVSPARTTTRPWFRLGTALGAIGAVALGIVLILPFARQWGTDPSYRTGIGQQSSVVLADGSRTELNAASELAVSYGKDRRRVVLKEGVGLFDVAKDKSRPFEVVAGNTLVRAVGTRFLVQHHFDDSVEVTVYEGIVEVMKADAAKTTRPLRLGVNQVAVDRTRETRLSVATSADLERKLAWREGRLVFDNTTLAGALEEVNRYSEFPIELADPELRNLRISGAFSTHDVAVFLQSLEQGFGLRTRLQNDTWRVSRS